MTRRWLAAAAIVLLSACRVDATVNVTVAKDGSGTITVTLVADADLATQAPEAVDRLRLDDLRKVGWTIDGPTITDDGGRSLIIARPFGTRSEAVAILGQLSGPDGPMADWRINSTTVYGVTSTELAGSFRLPTGTSGFADGEVIELLGGPPLEEQLKAAGKSLGESLGLTVVAVLPGKMQEPSSWTADLGGSAGTAEGQPFLATSRYGSDTRLAERITNVAPWALASWGALFLLVILPIAMLIGRRRTLREAVSDSS